MVDVSLAGEPLLSAQGFRAADIMSPIKGHSSSTATELTALAENTFEIRGMNASNTAVYSQELSV